MGPRQYSAVIAVLLVLVMSPLGASSGQQHASILKTPPKWTIMVYMADDFLPDLPWQDNINEMEAARQAPGTNIIVLVDPLGSNSSMLLHIAQDDGTHGNAIISPLINDSGAVIPSSGRVDMGSADTLRSFIDFSATNFSADHLVLIMWGHAGGWPGLCPDGNDILTLPEFGQALAGATSDIHRHLDVIGIDSCSEATIETLYEVYPYAQFMVASEKSIPDEGFPYTPILNGLASDPGQKPLEFASSLVRDYIDWSRFNSSVSASMGVFDLAKVGDLKENLDQMATTGAKYDSLFHEAMNDAFASAQYYDKQWNDDLGDLLGRLLEKPLPPDMHKAVIDTMSSYLDVRPVFEKLDLENPSDGASVNRATGAVIYAPIPDEAYAELQLAASPWYLFGRLARHTGPTNYSSEVPAVTYGVVTYDTASGIGRPVSVTLTWPGRHESSDASWFREEAGGLSYVDSTNNTGNQTTIRGEGNLTISANAVDGSVAQAHVTLNVTLFGRAEIKVEVQENGKNSTRDLDLRVIARNSTLKDVAMSGSLQFDLSVPYQVEIGDIVQVQVVDHKSGAVLGNALAIVGENLTTITVEVHQAPQKELPISANLLIALLPGVLILMFDLQLYVGDRKKRGKSTV